MSNQTMRRIKEAIAKGELIPYEKVMTSFSKKDQEAILRKARYLQAALALKRLRKKLKLSQERLAKKMKVKREFISRIESGEQNVTLETLYKIAEAVSKEFHFSFK